MAYDGLFFLCFKAYVSVSKKSDKYNCKDVAEMEAVVLKIKDFIKIKV